VVGVKLVVYVNKMNAGLSVLVTPRMICICVGLENDDEAGYIQHR
jgi:hypothetical protein